MKLINLEQGTPEWHAWRNNKVGGSDAPSVMGIGFMTPYQVYLNKLGLYNTNVTSMMRRGSELEPLARKALIEHLGIEVFPACVESDDYSFMGVSLDGIDKDQTFIAEIKTGGKESLEKAKAGIIADKHYCQIQYQLFVTKLDLCIYWFFDGEQGYMQKVYRDTRYIDKMVAEIIKFWDGVLTFTPPATNDKDYVEQEGEFVLLAEKMIPIVRKEKELEKTLKEIAAEKEAIRDRMIEISNEQSSVGGGVKLTRIPRKGLVDYKAIDVLKGVDLDLFRKPASVTWRVSLV